MRLSKAALTFRMERGVNAFGQSTWGTKIPACPGQIHLTTAGEKESFRGREKSVSSTKGRQLGPSNKARSSSARSLYENHSPKRHLSNVVQWVLSIPSRKPYQFDQLPAESGHLCAGI